MKYSWRWYGPNDPITLEEVRQTGASGIVTALHHLPTGDAWSPEEIAVRKKRIEEAGMTWTVVESIPVHDDIKKKRGDYRRYIETYKTSIRNIGEAGIQTVCYNFMPVLEWLRTNLTYPFPDGAKALRFDITEFAVFDIFILKRKDAWNDYPKNIVEKAETIFKDLDETRTEVLRDTIIKALPGSVDSYTVEDFSAILATYKDINSEQLKTNLKYFLKEIVPEAERAGVYLAIHPDDPPWSVFGLPRIVSTFDDIMEILRMYDSPSNGLTLCTGALGAGYFNDISEIVKQAAARINFLHLRNVKRDTYGNFSEDYLFEGEINIPEIVLVMLKEEIRRNQTGHGLNNIPVRPDHGNNILDDARRNGNPGYPLYGRMKGLAEIRGLVEGIRYLL